LLSFFVVFLASLSLLAVAERVDLFFFGTSSIIYSAISSYTYTYSYTIISASGSGA